MVAGGVQVSGKGQEIGTTSFKQAALFTLQPSQHRKSPSHKASQKGFCSFLIRNLGIQSH